MRVRAILFAACGPGTSTTSSEGTGGSPGASLPGVTTSALNLFDSKYQPAPATKGGQILIGDWQEANQFQYYYTTQVTEANVASAVWAALVTSTNDFKYLPDLATDVPTSVNGGVKAADRERHIAAAGDHHQHLTG